MTSPSPLPSTRWVDGELTGRRATHVVQENIHKNRTWNLFMGLELCLESLGHGEATSSKGISEEPTLKHESGGDRQSES